MNTNQKTENTQGQEQQKLIFLNFDRYFWSKDKTKLFLVLSGGITVPVHINFMKARLHLQYEPSRKQQKPAGNNEAQVA